MRARAWLIVLCVAPLAAGCSDGVSRPGASPSSPATQVVDGGVVDDRAPFPGTEGLSKPQLLDRSLSYPGSRGVVAGEVRSGGRAASLPPAGQGNLNERKVVDYEFLVTAVHGTARAPYAVGSTVTIRVPAASPGPDDDVLSFTVGQRLLVWATTQPSGGIVGASSPDVLPLPDAAYVAVVDGDRVRWLGHEEPLRAFLAHFREHPVKES